MPDAFEGSVRTAAANEALTAVTKYSEFHGGMDSWLVDFTSAWSTVTSQGHERTLCALMLLVGHPSLGFSMRACFVMQHSYDVAWQ